MSASKKSLKSPHSLPEGNIRQFVIFTVEEVLGSPISFSIAS